jgi:hypothetical protein
MAVNSTYATSTVIIPASNLTAELWVSSTNWATGGNPRILNNGAEWVGQFPIDLSYASGQLDWRPGFGDIYYTIALSNNIWYHMVATYDGTTQRLYVNGSLAASAGGTGSFSSPYALFIGGTEYLGDYMVGTVDEVRISSIARSPDWIKAEYNNQNAPGNVGSPGFWTWSLLQ